MPAQNFVYADIDGHIGYQAPGRIPMRGRPAGRAVPADGTWPLPGWDSRYDWTGYLPPSQLPCDEDPPGGVHRGRQPGGDRARRRPYPHPRLRLRLPRAADPGPARADATAHRKLQVEDMQAIQLDTHNGIAAELVPVLLKEKVGDAFTQQASTC